MAKKVQLQTNGKEWQVIDGEQVLVDAEKQDINPITSSSCVQIEGFRTLEEAVSDNKMLSQDLTYTKVMDKVGGDYHQNVLDGQYSKAILYGNTQVNLCEEDSSNALQIPTTFTSFNNGELQINNKENQVVAPLIKGVTMVNLCQETSATIISGGATHVKNIKGDTLYTLCFNFTTKNSSAGIAIQSFLDTEYLEDSKKQINLGDKVLITFITHENANKIHICNGSAYGGETIQLDDIMLIEGDQTALDIPYFKGMKSVELVRPLTNLFTDSLVTTQNSSTYTNNGGTVTVTSTSSTVWCATSFCFDFKPNTKYVLMWDSLSYTQSSTTYNNSVISICRGTHIVYNMESSQFTTKRSILFATADEDTTKTVVRIHATTSNTETGTTTVTGLRVFEYDDYLRSIDLQSIGWFSGTKNVAVEPIKTCSKNLYPYGDVSFTPTSTGWFDAKGNGNMYGDIAQKSKCRFLLKKGTYYLSMGEGTNISSVQLIDDKEEMLSYTPLVLEQDTYLTIRVNTSQSNVPTTLTNIQIERGETVTDYVAHDSRYYEPDGQNAIVLRSLPSGVCDTFNLQTGEYVQRIGEIVLNGSEDWTLNKSLGDGSFNQFTVGGVQAKKIIQQKVVCDRLISKAEEAVNNVIWIYDGTTIVIQSSCTSVDELKTWLQQNPLTVQYEFREPSITIIPRTIKRNNNGTISTVDFGTYTNKESLALPKNPSYLTINSMTSIKPVVEPITYIDFKTRLKTNTDYSVIIDKDSANKTINLGGTSKTYANKMLVRTPSIDLEQNLRISGSGSIQNIMVIEGDVLDKELPYFNGMCNVKMPIVRNCGKNLFNGNFTIGGLSIKDGSYDATNKDWAVTDYIKVYNMQDITFNSSVSFSMNNFVYFKYDINKKFLGYIGIYNSYTTASISLDDNVHYIRFRVPLAIPSNSKFQLEEGIQATSYEPYRGNDICIVKNGQDEIRLSQNMFEQGGTNYSVPSNNMTYEQCKSDSSSRLRSKTIFKINGGKTYKLTLNDSTKRFQWYLWGQDGKNLGITGGWSVASNTFTVTVPQEAAYMSLMFRKQDDSTITVNELNLEYFQLLELDSTVQLRSLPNGVKDELNLLTGEYIQRVGEVVLDGSEDWNYQHRDNEVDTLMFQCGVYDMTILQPEDNFSDKVLVCDKHKVLSSDQLWSTDAQAISKGQTTRHIRFRVLKSNLATLDVAGFKLWLSQNPTTVQYELAQPIISYPRIVSNTQEREVGVKLPNGICDTYNPSTGITVKRVGKIVLDGSEDWYFDTTKTNTQVFGLRMSDIAMTQNNLYCETMRVASGVDAEIIATTSGTLYIALLKTKASTVDELKTYLASNPITVYYELKNPIVTTDIVLPNGVHDEYNPLTGLYTKRVGYVELDGSEDWRFFSTDVDNETRLCLTDRPDAKIINTPEEEGIMSDKLPCDYNLYVNDNEGIHVFSAKPMTEIAIRIKASKLSTINNSSLKTYLSQNPIKVWYELATPITYQLTPYFGLPMPYAYKDGYLIMDSAYDGQTLPPEITYQLTINRTGQITQNNIKLKEHTARLSNLEYMLIEATLDSIFDREMQNFELELMNIKLINLDE